MNTRDEEHRELPGKICHIVTMIERRLSVTDFTVMLFGEELGH